MVICVNKQGFFDGIWRARAPLSLVFFPPLWSDSQSCHTFENVQVLLLCFPGKQRGCRERHRYCNCLVYYNKLTA